MYLREIFECDYGHFWGWSVVRRIEDAFWAAFN